MPPEIVAVCPLCLHTLPHTHFRGGGTWFADGRFYIMGNQSGEAPESAFFAPVCEGVFNTPLAALLAMTIEANGMLMN